ncbi:MAG: hypothetical protein ACM37Z_16805 [Deltaproteobacteria bacterium]
MINSTRDTVNPSTAEPPPEIRNISRKDAKAAKENVSELGALGALARAKICPDGESLQLG